MDERESPFSNARPGHPPKAARSWRLAPRFTLFGCVAAGTLVLYVGYRELNPPPPRPQPPNVAYCGNEILGRVVRRTARGLLIMTVGTPLAAIAGGLAGGITGGTVDCIARYYRRSG